MPAEYVFVAGATGFIGAEIVRALRREHPDLPVRALARSDASAERVRSLGAEPVQGDLAQPGPWREVAAQAGYVVHAAQPATFGRRLTRRAAKAYQAQRLAMDQNLIAALERPRLQRLVYVSGNSYFGDTGTARRLDETMEPNPTGFGPYVREAVDAMRRHIGDGLDAVIAFPGAVYGDAAWLKQYTLDPLRAGKPIVEVRGRSPVTSPVHVTDVARAIAFLLTVDGSRLDEHGRLYFVVDDDPLTFHEINEIAAGALGRKPRYRRLPAWLLGAFAGPIAREYLTTDAMYDNTRLKKAGFDFEHASARDGIPEVVSG